MVCYIVTDTGVTSGATPTATAASATDTVYIPSLSLSKTSGGTGTSTTLSESYYVPSTPYSYCLSTGSTSVS
jgi:hypothetical protein